MLKSSLILALAAMTLGLTGCSDDEVTNPADTNARVRVAHLSPDAPAVDVWVDGARVLENVPFKAFSSYLELPAGDYRVQVSPAGQTSPIVIDATLTLTAGTWYTVAATGTLANIGPKVLVDDPAQVSDRAKVRFIHASPDAPAVDITLADGTVLFGNVQFNDARDFLSTPGGDYTLQVRVAGTSTVVLTFNAVPLSDNTIYSVFATGLLADNSLGAVVAVDAPGDGSTTVVLP